MAYLPVPLTRQHVARRGLAQAKPRVVGLVAEARQLPVALAAARRAAPQVSQVRAARRRVSTHPLQVLQLDTSIKAGPRAGLVRPRAQVAVLGRLRVREADHARRAEGVELVPQLAQVAEDEHVKVEHEHAIEREQLVEEGLVHVDEAGPNAELGEVTMQRGRLLWHRREKVLREPRLLWQPLVCDQVDMHRQTAGGVQVLSRLLRLGQ